MKDTLIQVNSEGMGSADRQLSLILIEKYFQLLSEEDSTPLFIVFYNEGVKLLCEGAKTLEVLKRLHEKGTQLIGCGTCLDYFELSDKLVIGNRGSMQDIISLQSKVNKVITL